MLKILEYLTIGSALAFAICLIALMFFYGSPSATSQSPQQQHTEENKAVKNQGEADKPFWEKAMLTRAETVAEKTAQRKAIEFFWHVGLLCNLLMYNYVREPT